MINRWLVRIAVAELLVIALLSVWLWSAKREPPEVKQATREYAEARTIYDTVKVARREATATYRAAREVLVITDTVAVREVLNLADRVADSGDELEAAADTGFAKADTLIVALKPKPRLIQPFAELLYSPYSREYVGRLGVDANLSRRLSLVAATEIRQGGPGFAVGVRYRF